MRNPDDFFVAKYIMFKNKLEMTISLKSNDWTDSWDLKQFINLRQAVCEKEKDSEHAVVLEFKVCTGLKIYFHLDRLSLFAFSQQQA